MTDLWEQISSLLTECFAGLQGSVNTTEEIVSGEKAAIDTQDVCVSYLLGVTV